MKSELVTVTNDGQGILKALAMTEALGIKAGLEKKDLLHLRLLGEELCGLLRGIAGEVEADYWLETEGKKFELHMAADVKLTMEMRDQFLATASNGKNEAAKGFMGKLRVMIANALLTAKETLPYAMLNVDLIPLGEMNMESGSAWSMAIYKDELKRMAVGSDENAANAWDELEKSIVANIADDVKVKIVKKHIEITILKAF